MHRKHTINLRRDVSSYCYYSNLHAYSQPFDLTSDLFLSRLLPENWKNSLPVRWPKVRATFPGAPSQLKNKMETGDERHFQWNNPCKEEQREQLGKDQWTMICKWQVIVIHCKCKFSGELSTGVAWYKKLNDWLDLGDCGTLNTGLGYLGLFLLPLIVHHCPPCVCSNILLTTK